jgi:hypothetical protein
MNFQSGYSESSECKDGTCAAGPTQEDYIVKQMIVDRKTSDIIKATIHKSGSEEHGHNIGGQLVKNKLPLMKGCESLCYVLKCWLLMTARL